MKGNNFGLWRWCERLSNETQSKTSVQVVFETQHPIPWPVMKVIYLSREVGLLQTVSRNDLVPCLGDLVQGN